MPIDHYCPEGWRLFGLSCYLFSREIINSFDSALAKCQERDGYLVEIESKAEDDFIVKEVTSILIMSLC